MLEGNNSYPIHEWFEQKSTFRCIAWRKPCPSITQVVCQQLRGASPSLITCPSFRNTACSPRTRTAVFPLQDHNSSTHYNDHEPIRICSHNARDWLIGMLLVSRSGFVEDKVVEVFHYYVFFLLLLSWCRISCPFRKNNNVVVFPFTFHIFMTLANLRFARLQG